MMNLINQMCFINCAFWAFSKFWATHFSVFIGGIDQGGKAHKETTVDVSFEAFLFGILYFKTKFDDG